MALPPTTTNFKLPQIGPISLVDLKTGRPTNNFQSVWSSLTSKITGFFVDLAAIQAELAAQQLVLEEQQLALEAAQASLADQAQQIINSLAQAAAAAAVANQAQTAADGGAVPGARSGSNYATLNITSSSTWFAGPVVALTTVSAGDLTITGTGPAGNGSGGTATGQYRILENGVDIGFVGTWRAYEDPSLPGDVTIINQTIDAVTAYLSARVTTGSVTYQLEFQKLTGAFNMTFDAYLYVRRA